jgi:hypothetical protein
MGGVAILDVAGELDLDGEDAPVGRSTIRSTSCRPPAVRRCLTAASAAWA